MAEHDEIPVVRIPSDVDAPDKIVAGLTARQVAILAGVAVVLWLLYQGSRDLAPLIVFLPAAALTLIAAAVLVTASRDGIGLDRLLAAGLRFRRSPRIQVTAPEGLLPPPRILADSIAARSPQPEVFRSPVHEVAAGGVVDLGPDGVSALAECSTVNFTLRSPREQAVLLSGYSRWLNSLTGPVTISIRASPADLGSVAGELRRQAVELPNQVLRDAALEHADFLAELAADGRLLTRSIHLVAHEQSAAASSRARRRLDEAASLLAGTEVDVRPLDEAEAAAVLSEALNPQEIGS